MRESADALPTQMAPTGSVPTDSCVRLLDSKTLWPADAGASALVEAKQAVRLLRQSNAHAGADRDRSGGPRHGAEPDRARGAQVKAVKTPVDAQRRRQAARSGRQLVHRRAGPAAAHQLDSIQRLQCPEQDSSADSLRLAGYVDRVPAAVDEIDVGMPV